MNAFPIAAPGAAPPGHKAVVETDCKKCAFYAGGKCKRRGGVYAVPSCLGQYRAEGLQVVFVVASGADESWLD